MNNDLSISTPTNPRILILSMRNVKSLVSRSFLFEFEYSVCDFEQVNVLELNLSTTIVKKITRRFSHSIFATVGATLPIDQTFHQFCLDREYDLFLFICQYPIELYYLNSIKNWRKKCRKAVCWLNELWAKDVHQYKRQLAQLKNFDHVFMDLNSSAQKVAETIEIPCTYMPPGIDAIKFCPYPLHPQRSIDVCSIGRRPDSIHQSFKNMVNQHNIFYMYDTVKSSVMANYNEHRSLYRNIIKRSRYFIAYKPKFNLTNHTGDQEELSVRFFEGAAGGAVILGIPPNCEAFSQNFDWSDAVISLPEDTTNVSEIIAQLDSEPERLNKICTDNVVNSLLRHDWVYRWEKILDKVNISPSPGMIQRKAKLKDLAKIAREKHNSIN